MTELFTLYMSTSAIFTTSTMSLIIGINLGYWFARRNK